VEASEELRQPYPLSRLAPFAKDGFAIDCSTSRRSSTRGCSARSPLLGANSGPPPPARSTSPSPRTSLNSTPDPRPKIINRWSTEEDDELRRHVPRFLAAGKSWEDIASVLTVKRSHGAAQQRWRKIDEEGIASRKKQVRTESSKGIGECERRQRLKGGADDFGALARRPLSRRRLFVVKLNQRGRV
jgi:hypothetical protein